MIGTESKDLAKSCGDAILVGQPWELCLFNMVDDMRRYGPNRKLVFRSPDSALSFKMFALIAATVDHICREEWQQLPPPWAGRAYFLNEPWYVSSIENLYAMALVESPPAFRKSNIFVLSNFLNRC